MLWADSSALNEEQQDAELARIPLARLGGAVEIARAVRFLLSADAAYVTGAILPVDGGLRLR
jgi:pteridine reductase